MKSMIFTTLILGSIMVFAGPPKAHRHHSAHNHGAAELVLVFDQLQGRLEFKAASQGVLGFEHEPKTEKEKAKLKEIIAKFEIGIASMVQIDRELGCDFKIEKIEMVVEKEISKKEKGKAKGQHSDFIANYTLSCKKSVTGSRLTLDFSSFGGLNDIEVTLLVGDLQKSLELKGKPSAIELK